MRPIERIIDQLNAAFGGKAWYGPPLRNLLDGVTQEQATAHPIPGAHSILELVVHAGTWIDVVARRLRGEPIESTTVEDWSNATKTTFAVAIEELEHAESRLLDAVARLTPEDLDRKVPGHKHSVYAEIHGVLQHNVYHAGQIALLKKADLLATDALKGTPDLKTRS